MGNVGPFENHGFRSKFIEIRRMNFDATVAGERVGSLLVWQENDQVRLAIGGHDFFRSRIKPALVFNCNCVAFFASPFPREGSA